MKRLSVIVTAPVLAVSLLAATPAHAAGKVSDKDFLSPEKVGAALPALAGAVRSTDKLPGMPMTTSCTAGKVVKAKQAKVATYVAEATPNVVASSIVAEMKSVKDAKKVMASRRKELKCGTMTAEGVSVTYTAGKTAKLGDERVAQRMTIEGLPTVSDIVSFRKGARIITVALVSGDGADAGSLTPLAKQAYKVGL